MTTNYIAFEKYLSVGKSILDAGCGSGRDSLYFLGKGYNVSAFDASEEMVRLSSNLTKLPIKHCTFETAQGLGKFDGIWACASLLHVDRSAIVAVIKSLSNMLVKHGIFYMSFKYGDRVFTKDGRTFNCYDKKSFIDMINNIPNLKVLETYITGDVLKGRENEQLFNALLIKE